MAEDDDSKSEQPTDRRLGRARDEGDIAQSQEVKTVAVLMGITVFVWMMAPMVMKRLAAFLVVLIENLNTIRVGNETELGELLGHMALNIGLVMMLPLGFLLIVGVAASVSQTGWNVTTSKLAPDLNKLNPLPGLGRMFSLRSVMEMVKNIAKLGVVGAVVYTVMSPRLMELALMPTMEPPVIIAYIHSTLIKLLAAIVLVMVVIAAADWAYQRFSHNKKLRMTKQEVKDEHKQTEGDPVIKGRLRALRMQRARARMMAAVPRADVVVTNPTHYACALQYDAETMAAPVLVAKGQDLVAVRIRQIAEENQVPIVENPPLARALYASVELDQEIPQEHYKAVAEVISYVLGLKGKRRH